MNNLLSLLLGLASWGLGGAAVLLPESRGFGGMSLLCCAVALLLQLAQVHRLVQIGDWSALSDTMDAVLLAALVLTAVTALLNLTAYFRK